MSTIIETRSKLPAKAIPPWPLKRFTVEEYHRLIRSGGLNEDDKLELLDGWLVEMPKNPPHDSTIDLVNYLLNQILPRGWFLRIQNAMTLKESEPEPDVAVVRGAPGDSWEHHPTGADVALIVEVAHSSVDIDRDKRLIYARAGIPVFWIVNLEHRCLEVFTELRGRGRTRDYASRQQFELNESAELIIAGRSCGKVPVSEMIKI